METQKDLSSLIDDALTPVIHDTRPAAFTPVDKATPDAIIDAQKNTADWIASLGLDDEKAESQAQQTAARQTFAALTTGATTQTVQNALTTIKTPAAVQHLVGMLTAYDWEFVEQARQLRGYTVAKLLEECENPNANIRLKALGLLGKVTEVGLFTEKIEVKKTDLTEAEIDAKLKEKLSKFMDVTDVDVTDIVEVKDAGAESENPDA